MHHRMNLILLLVCISLIGTGVALGDVANPDRTRVDIPHGPIPTVPEPSGLPATGTVVAGIALSVGAISLIFLFRNRGKKQ